MKKYRALAMVLIAALLMSGCAAYKEHSTNMKDVVGEWVLDSSYKNTHSIETSTATMTIESDYSGSYTQKVPEMTVNEAGESVPLTETNEEGESVAVMKDETKSLSVSDAGGGEISINIEGESTTYRFNVDEAAGNLHLWVEQDGDEYHYIYILSSVYYDTEEK